MNVFYDAIPDDAEQVISVTGDGEQLQELVSHGVFPDLDGYWDDDDGCWYLWNRDGETVDWRLHIDAIRLAGGVVKWVRPIARNVNPSGRATVGWHLSGV